MAMNILVTSYDETWVLFVNIETKEQSEQWLHTHSPKKLKKFRQMSAFQKADGSCFLGQERIAYGGIHATWTTLSEVHILQITKRTVYGWPFRTRCGMLTSTVVLFHDNACLHAAACT
jgi:hypothetical protein